MSIERDLVSKILRDRDLAVVVDGGINLAYFKDYKHQQAFRFILEHYTKYSQVPSIEAFASGYDPTYKVADPDDKLQYYVDTIREHHRIYLLEDGLSQAVDTFEAGDTEQTEKHIVQTIQRINLDVAKSRTSDLTETGKKRIERYQEYAKSGGALKGVSSGFASIDAATNGFQRKQLVTIVGPPKAGKSTTMLIAAIAAHQCFYRPLFIGFEMTNEEQEERHDAIRAHISHKKLREGRLSGEEIRELDKMMRRLEQMPPLIFSEDTHGASTVSGVASLIDRHKPDIVYIDGVYMMEDENGERKGSPQAITNITRGFKRMAQNFDLPTVISTQVLEWKMDRKKGITSNSIGYSSSFGQDSDTVIGVENTDDPNVKKLKVVLGRNTPGMESFILWDWEVGTFTELEEREEDKDEAEEEPAKF